jgi:transketolase
MGKSSRLAFGEAIADLGDQYPDIVVLDADLSKSTMSNILPRNVLSIVPRRNQRSGKYA